MDIDDIDNNAIIIDIEEEDGGTVMEFDDIDMNDHHLEPEIEIESVEEDLAEEEDEGVSWLPDYFKLLKRDVSSVMGYVYSHDNLLQLLKLHSEKTCSSFIRHWRKTYHEPLRKPQQLFAILPGLTKGKYFNRRLESVVYECCRGKKLNKKKKTVRNSSHVSIKTGCTAKVIVTQLEVYYEHGTSGISRREKQRRRKELFAILSENPTSVKSDICFKVILPLANAHDTHRVESDGYYSKVLKVKVRARAESLIKQGICEMPVLNEMLKSYVDQELPLQYDLPEDMNLDKLYPHPVRLRNYINKYIIVAKDKLGPSDIEAVRTIKQNFIDKIRREAKSRVPWLPDYFRVTEITPNTVSGWLASCQQFLSLKSLCEARTRCTLLRREDDSPINIMGDKRIHFSLVPIPINKHPFKLDSVIIHSCMHDQQYNQNNVNNFLNCSAKMVAYNVSIFHDFSLPGFKTKIVSEIKRRKKLESGLTTEWVFVSIPLPEAHTCPSMSNPDFISSQAENDEKARAEQYVPPILPKVERGFDIVSNSCIVAESLGNNEDNTMKVSFISKKDIKECISKAKTKIKYEDTEENDDMVDGGFVDSYELNQVVSVSLDEVVECKKEQIHNGNDVKVEYISINENLEENVESVTLNSYVDGEVIISKFPDSNTPHSDSNMIVESTIEVPNSKPNTNFKINNQVNTINKCIHQLNFIKEKYINDEGNSKLDKAAHYINQVYESLQSKSVTYVLNSTS